MRARLQLILVSDRSGLDVPQLLQIREKALASLAESNGWNHLNELRLEVRGRGQPEMLRVFRVSAFFGFFVLHCAVARRQLFRQLLDRACKDHTSRARAALAPTSLRRQPQLQQPGGCRLCKPHIACRRLPSASAAGGWLQGVPPCAPDQHAHRAHAAQP
jgi:hypothetical protein